MDIVLSNESKGLLALSYAFFLSAAAWICAMAFVT